jgi:hypothetical protein
MQNSAGITSGSSVKRFAAAGVIVLAMAFTALTAGGGQLDTANDAGRKLGNDHPNRAAGKVVAPRVNATNGRKLHALPQHGSARKGRKL